jgi:hypothetical protein
VERSANVGYDAPMRSPPRGRRHIALGAAMPNTYTQLLFHVVFSTKNRRRTLPDGHREILYRYIWGIHRNLRCHLYRIGGVEDRASAYLCIRCGKMRRGGSFPVEIDSLHSFCYGDGHHRPAA